jgi:hypothetical protein
MKRQVLIENLTSIGYGILCLNAITIFIIPGVICRWIQDRN